MCGEADYRPSTFRVMSMTSQEMDQMYEIRRRLRLKKDVAALRAGYRLFGFDKEKRTRALEQIDAFISEYEKWRKA